MQCSFLVFRGGVENEGEINMKIDALLLSTQLKLKKPVLWSVSVRGCRTNRITLSQGIPHEEPLPISLLLFSPPPNLHEADPFR